MAEPMSPVGFYCDHSDEPPGARTHQEWEYVDGEGLVFRAVPEVSMALAFPKERLTSEQRERRCPRAVPVYAVDAPALAAEIDELRAQNAKTEDNFDSYAETVAMELAQLRGENARLTDTVARVRSIHTEFKIYEVCGHAHDDEDAYVVMVPEIGLVCRSGYQYSICRECCAPDDAQTEECVDAHDHSECWPCPTRQATDEASGGGS